MTSAFLGGLSVGRSFPPQDARMRLHRRAGLMRVELMDIGDKPVESLVKPEFSGVAVD